MERPALPRRVIALALVLLTAGCLRAPPVHACPSVAECLRAPGPFLVTVHGEAPQALTQIATLVSHWTSRAVTVVHAPVLANASTWNESALAALAPAAGLSSLDVVVLDGTLLIGDEPASGLTFPGQPTVFLFPGTMDLRVRSANLAPSDAAVARATLERIVAAHELGHALGLTGCGLPMVREHGDGSCHSTGAGSLMAKRVAHVDEWPVGFLTAPLGPFMFDADDAADLRASGLAA